MEESQRDIHKRAMNDLRNSKTRRFRNFMTRLSFRMNFMPYFFLKGVESNESILLFRHNMGQKVAPFMALYNLFRIRQTLYKYSIIMTRSTQKHVVIAVSPKQASGFIECGSLLFCIFFRISLWHLSLYIFRGFMIKL